MLQLAPTAATGASLVFENRNLLNIPVEVPDPPAVPVRRKPRPEATPPEGSPSHLRQRSFQAAGLPEMLARNLMERGESLGINKTLMSAVSEIRVCFSV
jgi:TBC1 domain family protein 5